MGQGLTEPWRRVEGTAGSSNTSSSIPERVVGQVGLWRLSVIAMSTVTEVVISNIWWQRVTVGVTIARTATCTNVILIISSCECLNVLSRRAMGFINDWTVNGSSRTNIVAESIRCVILVAIDSPTHSTVLNSMRTECGTHAGSTLTPTHKVLPEEVTFLDSSH